jgi:hypothetical protein
MDVFYRKKQQTTLYFTETHYLCGIILKNSADMHNTL